MKLEELYAEIAKDFPIDKTRLGSESVRTTDLFIKYQRMFSEQSIRLHKMENERKSLAIKKRDYYSGNGTPEEYKEKPFDLKVRSEQGIQKYVDSDADIRNYDDKIIVQREKVNTLSHCMDEIKRRGYAIKTALDYERFINGSF